MTTPKKSKAGRFVMPLKIHTVKNPQGKYYTYRGHKINFWFSEAEIYLLENVYNYLKKDTTNHNFTAKELSTFPKFLKAILLKYSLNVKAKYID